MNNFLLQEGAARTLNYALSPGYFFKAIGKMRSSPAQAYRTLAELNDSMPSGAAIYDPFCGNGTLLYVAAVCFSDKIGRIYGSDCKKSVVRITERNLGFTDPGKVAELLNGIEIGNEKIQPGKSYKRSREMEKAKYVSGVYQGMGYASPPDFSVFVADATFPNPASGHIQDGELDLIFTEPPYSNACRWYHDGKPIPAEVMPLRGAIGNLKRYIKKSGKVVLFLDMDTADIPMRLLDVQPVKSNGLQRYAHVYANE